MNIKKKALTIPGTLAVLFCFYACDTDNKNHGTTIIPAEADKETKINDSVRTIFCLENNTISLEKGDTGDVQFDKKFIEQSLQSKVADINNTPYCAETGLIRTGTQSIDSLRQLDFFYYILSGFSDSESLKSYADKIKASQYDRVTPVTQAPYTNYHFVVNDKLVLLSHYGLDNYYPEYDISLYIEYTRSRLK